MGRMKTGTADLPLHGGRVPMWLASRMARLGRVMVEALVLEYGRAEVLRRLADPFWFQSLGCVMGMDWHSSGITTSVLGALKRGLAPVEWELGIHVCGGRGRHSRRTPDELLALGERVSVDAPGLVRASRLVAKVDSAAVQDGFDLYLHGFVVTDDGQWTVVQQGMNPEKRQARRYHWLWDRAGSFVEEPHAAIDGEPNPSPIVNLTDRAAAAARARTVALAASNPEAVVAQVERVLVMSSHHDVRDENLNLRRLGAALRVAANLGPASFPELLLTPRIGQRTLFALALVAEVLHGAPSRFADPARFAFAHGGKDGHPFPVPLKNLRRNPARAPPCGGRREAWPRRQTGGASQAGRPVSRRGGRGSGTRFASRRRRLVDDRRAREKCVAVAGRSHVPGRGAPPAPAFSSVLVFAQSLH